MTTLQEAAQRAPIRRIEAVQRGESFEVTAVLKDCHKALSAIASEPQAEPVAFCALTPCGNIAYFDGKPMVMAGPAGNHIHPTPLYTHPAPPVEQPDANLMINGLTEAETSACASVAGLVGQPGAVGLSEREAFEKWGIAEGLQAKSDDRGMNYPLGDHLWRAWQARAALATQPVAPGWMPIETAPQKDGAAVLLAVDGEVLPGCWCYVPFKEIRDSDGRYVDQQDEDCFWMTYRDGPSTPTHWMPLPPPPAATQGAKT